MDTSLPNWLSWSNGYDICLPKFQDASRGSEFDSRWEHGHLGNSGMKLFFILLFSTTRNSTTDDYHQPARPFFCFKIQDPLVSAVRAIPGRWWGRKRTVTVAILDVWNCTQLIVKALAIIVHHWPLFSHLAHRYCECFASGLHCNSCNCSNCCNNLENAAVRQEAVEATLERNPNAFRPKIAPNPGAAEDADGAGRHNKVGNRSPLSLAIFPHKTRVS